MKNDKKKRISPEDFVRIWQTSETFAEVLKRTGMKGNSCSVRAQHYRKKGIALRKFHGCGQGRKINYAALAALADELVAPKS